jgi:hypothetical protein
MSILSRILAAISSIPTFCYVRIPTVKAFLKAIEPKSLDQGMSTVCRLPDEWQHRAEQYFGEDLSRLRIHVGPGPADWGCEALANAEAIYFAPGRFRPDTAWGRWLIAHELAHVVQQRRGQITAPPGAWLVQDPQHEIQADQLAEGFLSGQATAPEGLLPPAKGRTGRGGRLYQPVVTVQIQGVQRKFQGGVFSKDDATLWGMVEPLAQGQSLEIRKRMKNKLYDWVNAKSKRMLFGLKGYDKNFNSVQEVYSAVLGRVSSRDNRNLERQIANRVESSSMIRGTLSSFIKGVLRPHHNTWMKAQDKRRVLTKVPGGRYAPFYSFMTLAAGMISKTAKSLDEAVQTMCSGGGTGRPITDTAAFLADYAMVARDWCKNADGKLVTSQEITPMPEIDARRDHHTVNEQSAWVIRARAANVRLGAGPSATTKLVLAMSRWMMEGTYSEDKTKEVLCYIALALFTFWNLKREWLMTTSEIHTYHEVMLVAESMGVPLLRSMGLNKPDLAEFEYPDPHDIPG